MGINNQTKAEKQKKKEYNKQVKKEIKEIKKNYKNMDSCLINPQNLRIGNIEKCIFSKMIATSSIGETSFGYVAETYMTEEDEKLLVKLSPNRELYVDVDKINSNKDLRDLKKQITIKGITIGDKILGCTSGNIRIKKETLHSHPYFDITCIKYNFKQLKRMAQEIRK